MAFDTSRLLVQLNITGLQQSDPAQYQLIKQIIDSLASFSTTAGTPGPTGLTGATGPMGPMGAIIFADNGEEGDVFPPIVGPQGNPGTTGSQGPVGPALYGTDGEDGDGITQIFQTITGSSGALTLLEQHTASGSASLAFTTCITSAYDDYLFEFIDIVPATNAASLTARASTDGGSTYDSGLNYKYAYHFSGTGASDGHNENPAATSYFIAGGLSNSTAVGFSGSLQLSNPLSASKTKTALVRSAFFGSDSNYYALHGMGIYNSITAVNAIQFLMTSGNFSGTIRCYGISK